MSFYYTVIVGACLAFLLGLIAGLLLIYRGGRILCNLGLHNWLTNYNTGARGCWRCFKFQCLEYDFKAPYWRDFP